LADFYSFSGVSLIKGKFSLFMTCLGGRYFVFWLEQIITRPAGKWQAKNVVFAVESTICPFFGQRSKSLGVKTTGEK
jgi:hypothetical protein